MPVDGRKFASRKKKASPESGRSATRRGVAARGAGVRGRTVTTRRQKNPKFKPAEEQSELDGQKQVEAAVFQAAINGNVTAAIFYLCNRNPDRWRHIQKVAMEHSGRLDVPQTMSDLIRAAQTGGFRRGHRAGGIGLLEGGN